ncbi:MAG: acetylxylan esterase [Nanoarchaeota archaeon]
MKKFVLILFALAILITFLVFSYNRHNITGNVIGEIEKNESYIVSKVVFDGDDGKKIYGLFFEPLKKKFDVVIVLPAAAGTKESRRFYGEILAEMGYGSLILDQRGIGETDGQVNSFKEDFEAFLGKRDVHQFLMARDAVKAVDFLQDFKNVDEIGVLGESMGGRNAIISGGLDDRIKIALIISSAGYRGGFGNKEADEFLAYINPNSYINQIVPRRLLMLHSTNDKVIPIADARYTFSLASEPKRFVEFNETVCLHGYCEPMYDYIEEELGKVFG